MNLKKVMMELGNKLVLEHNYNPCATKWKLLAEVKEDNSTLPIVLFTDWLNRNPNAQGILAEMGVEWPTVKN